MLVRFWLMLREDWGLFRRVLGRRTHVEVGVLDAMKRSSGHWTATNLTTTSIIIPTTNNRQATFLRLFILGAVFSAPLWASRPLYNSTDLVSTLASAGDEVLGELFDEVSKATAAH
jgi:hypothetical protein